MVKRRSPIGQEAGSVLGDVTHRFSELLLKHGENVGAYEPRNVVLDLAAVAVGSARMHWFAANHIDRNVSKDGSVLASLFGSAYPGGSEHARALSTSHQTKAALLADLACSLCPLQSDCGVGGEELIKLLDEPKDRRRFVGRIRNHSDDRFCETNLKSGRLLKHEK